MNWRILPGDCVEVLAALEAGSAQTCVTSPPYWGLRDYGHPGQLGLEKTPEEYVAKMVAVFREVRRVLADDGTLWLNLGDSYTGAANSGGANKTDGPPVRIGGLAAKTGAGLKPKDLVGIPWRVAFALQADGWFLRSDIIWHKPNPMPESVTDRPTKAHEYVFLLAKSERYFYDAKAVKEASQWKPGGYAGSPERALAMGRAPSGNEKPGAAPHGGDSRNRRSVWTVASEPYEEAHFATYPPSLIEPCVLAGSRPGDTVLDPFNGSGTTGVVALTHGRKYVGVELNPEYVALAEKRLKPVASAAPFFGPNQRKAREVERSLKTDPRQASMFDGVTQ